VCVVPWRRFRADGNAQLHLTLALETGYQASEKLSGSDADRWLEVPAWMFERRPARIMTN